MHESTRTKFYELKRDVVGQRIGRRVGKAAERKASAISHAVRETNSLVLVVLRIKWGCEDDFVELGFLGLGISQC